MTNRKLIIVLSCLFTLLAAAASVAAQTNPTDYDNDGVTNRVDACPYEPGPRTNAGCPLATPTPDAPAPDRDGDGVADFVDRCPDQAGTGFTEGCPGEQTLPTQGPPAIRWDTLDHCLVANVGLENINIRARVPTAASPRTDILSFLPPGTQFAPSYMLRDEAGTPWYAGVGEPVFVPEGVLGWVSGAVVITNGACRDLPAPPSPRTLADQTLCLGIVPAGAGAPAFSRNAADSDQLTLLTPGSVFPASDRRVDASGTPWLRSLAGWVELNDVIVLGKCDESNFPTMPSNDDSITPVTECVLMVSAENSGVGLYSAMVHDPGFLLATLNGGLAFHAEYSGTDLAGHVWYNIGGWVDSADVLATGDCTNLPAPPIPQQLACQVLIPGWNPDVNMYRQPALDPAGLIYPIPAGMVRTALARAWDANNDLWYFLNYGEGGWTQRSQVIPLNPTACDSLPAVAPPADPNACLITVPSGNGVPVYVAPLTDPSQIINVLSPGTNAFISAATTVAGTTWYNLESWGGWVDGHQVIASGNCGSLPAATAESDVCGLIVPVNSAGVNLMDSYDLQTAALVITVQPYYQFTPTLAAEDAQDVRWYYVNYAGSYSGWVNSQTVIETAPEACAAVMPALQLNIHQFEQLTFVSIGGLP